MDHGAVITFAVRWIGVIAASLIMLALAPASANAAGATLFEPADGHHYDHLELAPMVTFDPGTGESPKWVLLASDKEMTKAVRYCRQFVWAAAGGAYHWGCNRWATGADQYGGDKLLALEEGTVYYWQVVSKASEGDAEVKSEVRSFAIDAEPTDETVDDISDHVHGTAYDDGTRLNLGAAAFVNSGVRVRTIASSRLAPFAFRIRLSHLGTVDLQRSYIRITSAAGTRYVRLGKTGPNSASGIWRLNASERRLRNKRFQYQAFLKSTRNGAMVRSQARVVLIRSSGASRPPAWTPTAAGSVGFVS